MVTATDAVILCGFSPSRSRSPITVWGSKVEDAEDEGTDRDALDHEAEDGAVDRVAVTVGHHNEPLAIRLFAEQRGLVTIPGTTVRHPTESWIGATTDALVVSPPWPVLPGRMPSFKALEGCPREAVVEAKFVGYFRRSHWRDEDHDGWSVPTYVWAQAQWQMIAEQLRVAWVLALIGTDLRVFRLEHDESLADAMQAASRDFWERYVVTRVRPPVDGSKNAWAMLRKAFPKVQRADMLQAGPAEVADMVRLAEIKEQKRALVEEEETLEQRLAEAIADAPGLYGALGNGLAARALWSERAGYQLAARYQEPTRSLAVKIMDASHPGLAKAPVRKSKKEEAA